MSIEERLGQLERESGNWRRLALVLSAVLIALLLVGQAKKPKPADLTVQSLTVVDANGTERAILKVTGDGTGFPVLQIFDKRGPRSGAAATLAPSILRLRNDHGKNQTAISLRLGDSGEAEIALGDYPLNRAGLIQRPDQTPHLYMLDRDGKRRVVIGSTTILDRTTGDVETTEAGSISLFNTDGSVTWKAPR